MVLNEVINVHSIGPMTITDQKIKIPWETPRKVFSPADVVLLALGHRLESSAAGSWVRVLISGCHPFRRAVG